MKWTNQKEGCCFDEDYAILFRVENHQEIVIWVISNFKIFNELLNILPLLQNNNTFLEAT